MKKRNKKIVRNENKRKSKQRKKISSLNIFFILLALIFFIGLFFINKNNIQNIFTKKSNLKAPTIGKAKSLNIGDIVYYNHKDAASSLDVSKQTVTIPSGNSSDPGSGKSESQRYNAKDFNTTWRVWDIEADPNKYGEYKAVLVSNTTVAKLYTQGAVGYIWWEHNAHKIASIFGYGEAADTSATRNFPYTVGSRIDNAPDMTEGDRGNWKIGAEPKDKINTSGSRSLTLKEAEEKLGMNERSIKNGTTRSKRYDELGYGKRELLEIDYVPQRNINSSTQYWDNKEEGKAINKNYEMTDRYYQWDKSDITSGKIPNIKYKDMLFNEIDGWCGLATTVPELHGAIGSYGGYFTRGDVNPSYFGVESYGFLGSQTKKLIGTQPSWGPLDDSPTLRVVTYLKSDTRYIKSETESNAWDIYQGETVDKNLKFKVSNLSQVSKYNINIKASKVNQSGVPIDEAVKYFSFYRTSYGKDEYNGTLKKFAVITKRSGTGNTATFRKEKIDNKYNVEVTGIPSDYDFKIVGKYGKQIDLDTDTNSEYEIVIYPKPGKYKIPVEYVGGSYDNTNFSVYGNVSIKVGYTERSSSKLTLKRGVSYVEIDNVDLFDSSTNTLRKITDIKFNKSYDDNSSHTVRYDSTNKKLIVTYVPKNKNITVSVDQDSKKYLSKISEIRLRLTGGTNRSVTLRPSSFSSSVSVPERDSSGRLITYRLEKVAEVPGYYMNINGYTVSLKPIIKLPYTGTELSKKNIAVISLGMFGVALAFRFRKKIVLMFKEYTIMR